MRWAPQFLLALFLLVVFPGCGVPDAGMSVYGSAEEPALESTHWSYTPEYAKGFTIASDTLRVMHPTSDGEIAVIPRPSGARIVTLSTTHVALLEAAGALDHWVASAYTNYLVSPAALERIAAGQVAELGEAAPLDLERLLAASPSVLTSYPFGDPLAGSGIANRIPVVPVVEYLEPHPLGRAEWMVALAWLVSNDAADETLLAFHRIAGRYKALASAAEAATAAAVSAGENPRPRVFTGSVENGVWHAPGSGSFIACFLRDAGAEYLLPGRDVEHADDNGTDDTNAEESASNVEIPFERMLVLREQADAWGLVMYHADGPLTRETVLAEDPRHAEVMPASGKVFGANTATCDYFGRAVARPDEVLADLVGLFHPELAPERVLCFDWLPDLEREQP
jgi:iron complex transport system substrate-binding protein